MSLTQRVKLLSLGGALAAGAAMLAPAAGHAADLAKQPMLAYDDAVAVLIGDPDSRADTDAPDAGEQAAVDPAALECMAKVVMHEAGAEPRAGKVAVAQTLVNRLEAGRFGSSICAVAQQRGQFFDVASYNPRRDTAMWTAAMEVAQAVLNGDANDVAPGAMFFRAASSPASAFFRTRPRIAMVGSQVFYR